MKDVGEVNHVERRITTSSVDANDLFIIFTDGAFSLKNYKSAYGYAILFFFKSC